MMFNINLVGPRGEDGQEPCASLAVPALPRVGDHVSADNAEISGYVHSVGFWWDERDELTIEVKVR